MKCSLRKWRTTAPLTAASFVVLTLDVLHARSVVTDPKVFKTLATSVVGVVGVKSPSARAAVKAP